MFSRILVPLDGSELSEQALPVAMDLAHHYGSEILLVRATQLPDMVVDVTGLPVASLAEMRRNEELSLRTYLEGWQARVGEAGLPCRIATRVDGAAQGIVAQAELDATELIVMSTHGRSGFNRWVQGSVAERVARRAPCPVLLVRTPVTAPVLTPAAEEPAHA